MGVDDFSLVAINLYFPQAAPSSVTAEKSDSDKLHFLFGKFVHCTCLVVGAAIDKRVPRFAIKRTFNPVAVGSRRLFPCKTTALNFASFSQIDLQPLWSAIIRRAPASRRIPIDRIFREVVFVALFTGGGRFLPLRQVHWNLLRLVKDQVILIELVTGPERSTRQQVKKLGVTHRFIVVTQRCAKDPSPVIFVGPDTNLLISFFTILCRG